MLKDLETKCTYICNFFSNSSATKTTIAVCVCVHIEIKQIDKNSNYWGFPGGAVVKNLPANAGDAGLSPGPGRSHMPRSN